MQRDPDCWNGKNCIVRREIGSDELVCPGDLTQALPKRPQDFYQLCRASIDILKRIRLIVATRYLMDIRQFMGWYMLVHWKIRIWPHSSHGSKASLAAVK